MNVDISGMQQLFNSVARELEKKSEELADTIFNAPEAEVLVKTATNNDQWGPSGTEMMKIADLTHRYQELRIIMDALWARITERREGKNWRNVYKGLLLLDYLLKNGSDKVVSETRSRIYELKQLTRFNYIDSGGVDRGLSIRERTKQIIDLAHDTERLKDERKNAKKNRGKFQSAISSESNIGHYASQDHFRRTDPYYGRETHSRKSSGGFDDSDEDKPSPRHHHQSKPRRRSSKGDNGFFDSDSDSEARAAKTEVPKKEAWEPFPTEKKGAQPKVAAPVAAATFDDDDDWGEFTSSTPTPAAAAPVYRAPAPAGGSLLGDFASLSLNTPTTPTPTPTPTPVVSSTPDLLGTSLLAPTPVGGQTSFLEKTTQASITIDKNDPWAAGAHLFSLSAVNAPPATSANVKPFGSAGSTFSTASATPSTFGSASGIPATTATPSYTGFPSTTGYGQTAGYGGAATGYGYGQPAAYGTSTAGVQGYPGVAGYGQPAGAGYPGYTTPTGY